MSSTLIWIEAVVCFGPLASILALGALIFPMWVVMLGAALIGAAPWVDGAGASMWLVVAPMTFVVGGLVGLVGLFRVLLVLTQSEHPPRPSTGTAVMVLTGLVALVALNLYDPPSGWGTLLVYVLLPGIASLHLLYLARAMLLPSRG